MNTTRGKRCTYDEARGWLNVEHVRDCDDRDCPGCRPCGKTHCGHRGCSRHVDPTGTATCGVCIGKVRTKLAAIENLYALDLPEEALHAGIESEAFALTGPAADADQMAAKVQRGITVEGATEDDQHPYLVLGKWDLALRETYGPDTGLVVTVSRAREYLASVLHHVADDPPTFDQFARDVTACLARLESVAHDSRTPEQGAPCPTCSDQGERGPRLRKRYADHDRSGASDTWHCPDDPDHWWSDEDYRLRVGAQYVEHSDRLTCGQLADRFGVPRGSVQGWASKGLVKKRGKDAQGRMLYDVEDVTRMLATPDTA